MMNLEMIKMMMKDETIEMKYKAAIIIAAILIGIGTIGFYGLLINLIIKAIF